MAKINYEQMASERMRVAAIKTQAERQGSSVGPQPVESGKPVVAAQERQVVIPAEQCEILQAHQHYKWFKEGMWASFLKNTKDAGLTEEERKSEFEKICRDNLQEDVQDLVRRGRMPDWQTFSAPQEQASNAGAEVDQKDSTDEEIVVPAGMSDETAEAEQSKSPVKVETPKPAELKSEAKDWREVKRETEVDVVGDLHSNYAGLKENLATLAVATEISKGKLHWIGGKRKLVFIGDILADRNFDGEEILMAIEDLREQAKAAGGEIRDLAGNHDDFAMAFLMGHEIAGGGDPIENSKLADQGLDLLKLSKYGSEELKSYDFEKYQYERNEIRDVNGKEELVKVYDPVWELLRRDQSLILENMRKSDEGRKLLEAMCNMDIAMVQDDILYVHTDPEVHMVESFLESKRLAGKNIAETVENFNHFFKQNLRAVLLEGKESATDFDQFRAVFLRTNNRINFADVEGRLAAYKQQLLKQGYTNEQMTAGEDEWRQIFQQEADKLKQQLKEKGINAIVHGHSSGKTNEKFDSTDFPIISSDMAAFKAGDNSKLRSVVRVKTDGTVERGTHSGLPDSKGQQVVEIRSR